jgi:hypothetical protein
MSFLTGGLAGIMAAYRPTPAAAAQQTTSGGSTMSKSAMLEAAATPHAAAAAAAAAPAPLGVESLMSAVVVAVDELPVWESPEVEQVGAAEAARQGCSRNLAAASVCQCAGTPIEALCS